MKLLKGLLGKLGAFAKPLWKGAACKLLAYESAELRRRVKAMIDDDADNSILRVNRVLDGWQAGVIKGLRGLFFLPAALADNLAAKVQEEGDKLQARLVGAIKERGPAAVDAAFDGLEARLGALIDAA